VTSTYLSILILNYNGYDDTVSCLESVLRAARGDCEIVVIDNASSDGSVEKLLAWGERQNLRVNFVPPQRATAQEQESVGAPGGASLTLIRTPANLGFAGGNNVGIRYALRRGAQWVLLLNNDTVVDGDSLAGLVEGAERTCAQLAGCSIYEYFDRSAPYYLGGKFSWWGDRTHSFKLPPSAPAEALETDWITGCCLLVRREVFERIGLLDERAFLYYEDADFCRRAAQAGLKRVVVLGARIYHKVSRSSVLGSPFTCYHATMSRIYFHRKHHHLASHVAFLTAFLLRSMARSLVWLATGRRDLVDARWRAVRDAYGARSKPAETLK
jgi:GT2 family glycosyltransferase